MYIMDSQMNEWMNECLSEWIKVAIKNQEVSLYIRPGEPHIRSQSLWKSLVPVLNT